jgi:hypothetical protein
MTDPAYAQNKYKEAMDMINDIVDGDMTLTDPVTGEPLEDQSTSFSTDDFLPNDASTPPFFTMGAQF